MPHAVTPSRTGFGGSAPRDSSPRRLETLPDVLGGTLRVSLVWPNDLRVGRRARYGSASGTSGPRASCHVVLDTRVTGAVSASRFGAPERRIGGAPSRGRE